MLSQSRSLVSLIVQGISYSKLNFYFLGLVRLQFRESGKFRAVVYPNFGVLLQDKYDLIPETEYAALIGMYHSMDNTKL